MYTHVAHIAQNKLCAEVVDPSHDSTFDKYDILYILMTNRSAKSVYHAQFGIGVPQ